jgi:hypothetical protein
MNSNFGENIMTPDAKYTRSAPLGSFGTGGSSTVWSPRNSTPTAHSKSKLIEMWFLDPLRNMNGHQAFICLSSCLLLYEKYLKKTGKIGNNEKFSQGHTVFNQIGKDFGISSDNAYEFWTCWRNGFAHHGIPKKSRIFNWGLAGDQSKIVCIIGSSFTVNPWLMRDKILNKIEKKKNVWDDELAPLMQEFKISTP